MAVSFYRPGPSPAHTRHPVAKLLSLVLLFVPPLAFNRPAYAVYVLALYLGVVALAKGLPNLRRVAALCVILIVFSTLIWALMLPGHEHTWALGPVGASPTSVAYGLAMGMRLVALLLVGVAYVSATRPEEFTYALRRAGMPVTPSLALSLAFRLVPMLANTTQTVVQAQTSRGLDLREGGLLIRLKRYVPLIVPIMGYAMRSADDLSRALEARGLGAATRERTEFHEYRWRVADTALVVVAIALAAGCIWARLAGYGEIVPRL